MFRFQFNRRFSGKHTSILLFSLSCAVAAGMASAAGPEQGSPSEQAEAAARQEPEALLIDTYKEIAANNLRAAQEKADRLVEAHPNFRPGQLVRSDLLLKNAHQAKNLGGVDAPEERLKNLRAEALARLNALRERPDPRLVPQVVQQLRDDQKHVLLVDARRSRLYVYANDHGQLKFVADYYVSPGAGDKLKETDPRMPVGLYYLASQAAAARAPAYYGSGAMPANYPGAADKTAGQGGSGVWLRGMQPVGQGRAASASDSCVVLTNADMNELARTVEFGRMPVVVDDSIDFISKSRWENERAGSMRLLEDWRRDVESRNRTRLLTHYSRNFRSERGEDLKTWFNKPQRSFRNVRQPSVEVHDITFFLHPGQPDTLVATFTQDSTAGQNTSSVRKRQYWKKEGKRWKIVYEQTL